MRVSKKGIAIGVGIAALWGVATFGPEVRMVPPPVTAKDRMDEAEQKCAQHVLEKFQVVTDLGQWGSVQEGKVIRAYGDGKKGKLGIPVRYECMISAAGNVYQAELKP